MPQKIFEQKSVKAQRSQIEWPSKPHKKIIFLGTARGRTCYWIFEREMGFWPLSRQTDHQSWPTLSQLSVLAISFFDMNLKSLDHHLDHLLRDLLLFLWFDNWWKKILFSSFDIEFWDFFKIFFHKIKLEDNTFNLIYNKWGYTS